MYNYKLFLPTAGIGSRVSGQSNNLNKGLIGIDNKPVLSHIIEKFHPQVEIVVALGYGGDYVKQYLEIVYPERILVSNTYNVHLYLFQMILYLKSSYILMR